MAQLDEATIAARLRAALAGDNQAYRDFLTSIAPVMRGIVAARLPHTQHEQVEDVVQEVLLSIHAKRHTWRQDHPVLPWLYAIARHKATDLLRARGRDVLGAHATAIEEAELHDAEFFAVPAAQEQLSDAMDIETAVAKLDGRVAEVVRLMAIEHHSVADTATALKMSENAVRVAFHRGLKAIVGMREAFPGQAR
ncbi:MAG: hypothetical protein CSB44_01700 [Gammaproteobacteria bacterium]|nr:MAG: hypothetical protein CSB44_01700 [Gammaproteobacteria bacterium]